MTILNTENKTLTTSFGSAKIGQLIILQEIGQIERPAEIYKIGKKNGHFEIEHMIFDQITGKPTKNKWKNFSIRSFKLGETPEKLIQDMEQFIREQKEIQDRIEQKKEDLLLDYISRHFEQFENMETIPTTNGESYLIRGLTIESHDDDQIIDILYTINSEETAKNPDTITLNILLIGDSNYYFSRKITGFNAKYAISEYLMDSEFPNYPIDSDQK